MKEQPNETKARELVEKFLQFTPAEEEFEFEYAKQCALMACDEILNVDAVKCRIGLTSFWQSVKQEITKL